MEFAMPSGVGQRVRYLILREVLDDRVKRDAAILPLSYFRIMQMFFAELSNGNSTLVKWIRMAKLSYRTATSTASICQTCDRRPSELRDYLSG